MKALALWQPWASLVAIGAKRIETRHWEAPAAIVGQRVAIHAAKTKSYLYFTEEEPFRGRLRQGLDAGLLKLVEGELPLGAIVATAVLDRCSPMTREGITTLEERDPDERAFGNYNTGRFAWVLKDLETLADPVPFTGRQGIFDVPDELLRQANQGALL